MSGKSSRRDTKKRNNNDNYLRSQSMVPELEQQLSKVTMNQNLPSETASNIRSTSSERKRVSSVVTNFKTSALNNVFCARPDGGGTVGRQTVLKLSLTLYLSEILQKTFRDCNINCFAYDGDKNVYTVNKIDSNLKQFFDDGVSLGLLKIKMSLYFLLIYSFK